MSLNEHSSAGLADMLLRRVQNGEPSAISAVKRIVRVMQKPVPKHPKGSSK